MAEQPTQKEFKAVDIVDYAMSSQPIRVNDALKTIFASTLDVLAKPEINTKDKNKRLIPSNLFRIL